MPSFVNPFSGNIDRKISKTELLQALRVDIASELEAIYLYDAHSHATEDPLAAKVLADIRDEEIEHVGELMALMRYLDPRVADLLLEGEGEVKEMMEDLGISQITIRGVDTSVGSLIKGEEED
ncbi:ubiquinone biosynthesis protein COQ7 [Ruminococcaceae bacterium OttesenSCG-928-O06]|nr:ubiquinone biosynthesis protein COQ7 [Ruminococcaceae bacterium OttesenSCG-928-O06]